MLSSPFPVDILPKAFVAAGLVYGVAHYGLIGVKIGERVVAADHIPVCRADLVELAQKAGEQKRAAIPLPTIDPMQEYAIRQAEQIYNSPFMIWAQGASQGLADGLGLNPRGAADALRETYQANKRAAQDAHRIAQEKVRAWTAAQVDAAGDTCACLGQKAIEANRTDWALYTGSLTLYQPAAIASFEQQMANVLESGTCASGGDAS